MAIKRKGEPKFVTQCYVKGHPQNDTDGVIKGIKDKNQRNAVMVAFDRLKGSDIGELRANFDVVLGWTPAE